MSNGKEIVKEQLSPETKDSWEIQWGRATNQFIFEVAEANHSLVLRLRVKINLKTMLLSGGKKKEKNRNKINGRYKKIIIRFA